MAAFIEEADNLLCIFNSVCGCCPRKDNALLHVETNYAPLILECERKKKEKENNLKSKKFN
jgi:hypothetical protein